MRRFTRLLIVIISLFFVFSNLYTSAAFDQNPTETGGTSYQITERKITNDLGYSISQYTDIAKTTRLGQTYNQQVNIMEIPTSTQAKIISYANLDNHRWTLTTVKDLAKQFEARNPTWKVIGAINADFFDINAKLNGLTYQTHNPVVTEGEFYKTSLRNSVLGFTNNGSTNTLVGGKTNYRSEYMFLAIYNDENQIIKEFSVEKLNQEPLINQTSVYFGIYNATTFMYEPITVNSNALKTYFIENAELALPNNANDFYGKGVITSLSGGTLQKGQFAVSTNNTELLNYLNIGVKIRVQYQFVNEFSEVTSATGYQGKFLENGEFFNSGVGVLEERHPRTTVGVRSDGTIVMAVIDGRQSAGGMDGVYGDEMASIMKRYGCVEAYNLDGGGSSTMIIRQNGEFKVMNSPSDGNERKDANCLLIAIQMPQIALEVTQAENSLTIDAMLIDKNRHDIVELYIEIMGIQKKVEDSQITFDNLVSNTNYFYRFLYKDSNGEIKSLIVDGIIKTLKKEPTFVSLEIFENGDFYELTLKNNDPDYSGAFNSATLHISGKIYTIRKGELILNKTTAGTDLNNLKLIFAYDLNDGEIIEKELSITYLLTSSTEVMLLENKTHNQCDWINSIYK